jgi:hypothetical protein
LEWTPLLPHTNTSPSNQFEFALKGRGFSRAATAAKSIAAFSRCIARLARIARPLPRTAQFRIPDRQYCLDCETLPQVIKKKQQKEKTKKQKTRQKQKTQQKKIVIRVRVVPLEKVLAKIPKK